MGNSQFYLREEEKQTIYDVVHEILCEFRTNLIHSMFIKIHNKLTDDMKDDDSDDEFAFNYAIEKQQIPSWNLKIGTLAKVGYVVKNWKQRYFILHNQNKNYTLNYYDRKGGTLKGSVLLQGYKVKRMVTEECQSPEGIKEYGIKLVPTNDDHERRIWKFKTEDQTEAEDWYEWLDYGCSMAVPEFFLNQESSFHKDVFYNDSFISALKTTRYSYKLYGWFGIQNSEVECLANVMADVVEQHILTPSIASLNIDKTSKEQQMITAKAFIRRGIINEIQESWQSSKLTTLDYIKKLKDRLEEDPSKLNEHRSHGVDTIEAMLLPLITPIFDDISSKILRPILREIHIDIIEIYKHSFRHMSEALSNLDDNYKKTALDSLGPEVTNSNSKYMRPSYGCLNRVEKKLIGMSAFFQGPYNISSICDTIWRDITYLNLCGLVSFSESMQRKQGSFDGFLKQWKIEHEKRIKNLLQQLGIEIIDNLVDWQKYVVIPCKEYIKSEKFNLMSKFRDNELPFCYTCKMFFDAYVTDFLKKKVTTIIADDIPIKL